MKLWWLENYYTLLFLRQMLGLTDSTVKVYFFQKVAGRKLATSLKRHDILEDTGVLIKQLERG